MNYFSEMKVLVIDAKTESIQFSLYLVDDLTLVSYGKVEKIGKPDSRITIKVQLEGRREQHVEIKSMFNHFFGLKKIIDMLMDEHVNVIDDPSEIIAVGHKVAHGGEFYSSPAIVTKELKHRVKRLTQFAPKRNAISLTCIDVCQRLLNGVLQIAVFDTAFHQTVPEIAYKYPIPERYYEEFGLRSYGTQGIAHAYAVNQTAQFLNKDVEEVSLISIHIDTACSIAAVKDGACIDTSGGLGPASGLSIATGGDIDPAILFYLSKNAGMKMKDLENVFFSENSDDVSALENIQICLEEGSIEANQLIEMLCYKIKKHIGMYLALLENVDAIVFTGETGEESSVIRRLSLENLQNLGVQLDDERNNFRSYQNYDIGLESSKVKILVMPSDEQMQIAKSTQLVLEAIPVE